MSYRSDFLNQLKNADKWPSFENGIFLDKLHKTANMFYNKHTLEGYIASLVVYVQITEDMIKVLVDSYSFYLQCTCFPNKINKHMWNKDRDTFWSIISKLDSIIITKWIIEIKKKCKKLNLIRNDIVHKMTQKNEVSIIQKQAEKWRELYEDINILFWEEYDVYRVSFHNELKDIDEKEELL